MAVSPVTNTPTTTTTPKTSAEAQSAGSLAQTFDTFLTLLTTQLKNQDPLSPMDSAQFTQQLVSYAGVEQQINANTKLQKLLDQNSTSEMLNAASYLDKYVEADTNKFAIEAAGTGTFAYNFEKDQKTAAAVIQNENGEVVRSLSVAATSGRHEVTWDGKTKSGADAPAGTYTVVVTGLVGENEQATAATVSTFGKVTNVRTTDDGTLLTVAGADVALAKVKSVRNSPPASASSSS